MSAGSQSDRLPLFGKVLKPGDKDPYSANVLKDLTFRSNVSSKWISRSLNVMLRNIQSRSEQAIRCICRADLPFGFTSCRDFPLACPRSVSPRFDQTPARPWHTPRAIDSSCHVRRIPYPHGLLLRAHRRQIGWVSAHFKSGMWVKQTYCKQNEQYHRT